MGWNRDGLAFRAYKAILDSDIKNTLSIVITDANPQDLKPLTTEGLRLNKPYQDEIGLNDASENINILRKKGLKIAAIINGDHIENSKTLYRNNFIKINSPTGIASAAGKFIKKQISTLDK